MQNANVKIKINILEFLRTSKRTKKSMVLSDRICGFNGALSMESKSGKFVSIGLLKSRKERSIF